jgi:hypothetical protein
MKLVFDLSRNHLTIEGDGKDLIAVLQAVREVAPRLTEIKIVGAGGAGGKSDGKPEIPHPPLAQGHLPLREFAKSLNLTNMAERIAAIGYYIMKVEGKLSFSPKEMGERFMVCGFQKPTQMPVAMFDSKRKYGYTESTERGQWKLTTGGENLITRKIEESKQEE